MSPVGSRPSVFLQPHYDDAALSCGGTIAAVAAAGLSSHVVTIFAGEVLSPMMSELANRKHARWKLADVGALAPMRRNEDAHAAEALGCTLRWLGMPDAIYRGDRYASDDELFGVVHADEAEMADHLAEELLGLPEWDVEADVFVPLGAGFHVDHLVAFQIGQLLAARGQRVFAYADSPYAIHTPAGLDARLAQVRAEIGGPLTVDISKTLDRKLAAIAAYDSQVPVIFRFTDDFRAAVTTFDTATGDGRPAERFWPILA